MNENDFARSLVGEIPLHEAADFFVKLKHAGWKNPQSEEYKEVVEFAEAEKNAVSNKWVAKGLIGGLDSRAAKVGMHPLGSAESRMSAVSHALGGANSDHGVQSHVVQKLKSRVMPEIENRARDIKSDKARKKTKTLVGIGAGVAAAGGLAAAVKKHSDKEKYASLADRGYKKGLAHGAMVGAGVGMTGTAVALDKAHQWADNRNAKKTASQMMDHLLACGTVDGKAGHTKLAMLMKLAAAKFAAPMGNDMPTQDDSQTTPVATETPVDGNPPLPPEPEPLPDDYVKNELNAMAAQNANEAAFYRGQVESSQQQTEQLQQQVQQMQEQLGQIQNQAAVSGVQVQSLTNQATQANDRALQYSSETANIRMGVQKMREALMQLASQDPAAMGALSEQGQAQQAEDQAAGAVGPDGQPVPPEEAAPGTPENSPAASGGAPTGAAPADAGSGAEEQPEAKPEAPASAEGGAKEDPKTSISIKHGSSSALPWMAGGAVLGAADGVMGERKRMKDMPQLHSKVQELEAAEEQGSTFEQALSLARAKADLEQAKITSKYPDRAMTRAALAGGKQGMMLGSSMHSGLQELGGAWTEFNR